MSFAPSSEVLKIQTEGATMVACIDRQGALNALNAAVLQELDRLVTWLESEGRASVRTLILTGAGDKAFVAGADISEFAKMSSGDAAKLSQRGLKLFARIEALAMPVIAAVNGFALGGGLELALSADFIYASENAKFALPECSLGLMPGYGGTVRLPRRIGSAQALEVALSGQMIGADEALRIGLVNRVLPKAELLKAALETAAVFASRAPLALGAIKRSVHRGADLSQEKASVLESELFAELFATEDQKEGVSAFLQKRKSAFLGR